MKSFAAATVLIATSALALPTANTNQRRSTDPASVISNIAQWTGDIFQVNAFLDKSQALLNSPPVTFDFVAAATTALGEAGCSEGCAADEPVRLGNLMGLTTADDTGATNAAADLQNIFPGVIGNLTAIIQSDNDLDTVQNAISAIVVLRCNSVLPDIQELWTNVLQDNGLPSFLGVVSGSGVCPTIEAATL
ncbi:hypothetical protein LTR36_005765 [Oleoguttula mirabilis]|uniref:Uncharacterized protein n=1 Tax=Oleoguttula mirabilis TaxID=1507867 RepID=A0AAV9JDG0_9PEZI|nr:hypothetical protein LTR36_005765 [Oleoguttula mirabilis]